jgi:RNA recognition motif-containing protein
MKNKLFFGNLDWTTDKDEVHDHFSPFGEIVEISIAVDKENGMLIIFSLWITILIFLF